MAKKPESKFDELAKRLLRETHEIHRATGSEQPQDVSRQQVIDAINEVWPDYLRSEIAKTCGMVPQTEDPSTEE